MKIEIGQRYRLLNDVERYPSFIAPQGAVGTVTFVSDDLIGITMDKPIPGAEQWNNEVQWTFPEDEAFFAEDCQLIDP